MLKKDDIVIFALFLFILNPVACHIAGNRQVFQESRHVSFGVTTTRELAIRMWCSPVCSCYPVVMAECAVSIPRSVLDVAQDTRLLVRSLFCQVSRHNSCQCKRLIARSLNSHGKYWVSCRIGMTPANCCVACIIYLIDTPTNTHILGSNVETIS